MTAVQKILREITGCAWMVGLLVVVLLANPIAAWGARTTVEMSNGLRIFIPMKSFKALRDENMIRQAYDYSCGAAALATFMTYGLGDQVTEEEILREVANTLSKDEQATRKKKGLSLLDLQKLAQARGYNAQGFRLAPNVLPKLSGPVLVFITPQDYEHFAILRGVRGTRAYLADPSFGNVRMPLYQFVDMWLDEETGKGIVFILEPANGGPLPANSPLYLPGQETMQPEVLSTRQLLELQALPGRPPQDFPSLP